MAERASTLESQLRRFAAHVRDPSHHPAPPGIAERRLAIYRELFHDGIAGLLAGNFPVLRELLGAEAWRALVDAFYADHRCRTPLFTEVGREFVDFLETQPMPPNRPWLHELAHYEWVELALQIADDALPPHDRDGDLLDGLPVCSPLAWALAYRWPVHRIGPQFQPTEAPAAPALLLVRRDAAGDVRFSEISPPVYRLFALLGEDGVDSGRTALRMLAREAGAKDVDAFVGEGAAMLARLHEEGVLIGIAPRA